VEVNILKNCFCIYVGIDSSTKLDFGDLVLAAT